jgi:hypothetical protein
MVIAVQGILGWVGRDGILMDVRSYEDSLVWCKRKGCYGISFRIHVNLT